MRNDLRGVTGYEHVETDANGRSVRTLRSILPVSGNNLLLALDARLQQVAEQVFGDRRGSLVAIEPNTGGVLALVSKPGFDPNLFVEGIDPQNWEALNNSPDHPLNNRALQGVYPPGSTFKPFMALAGLEIGQAQARASPSPIRVISSGRRWRPRLPRLEGRRSRHGGPAQGGSRVLRHLFLWAGAQDLGIDAIHQFIGQFGLGKKTGIDIDGEVDGLLPSQEWKQRRFQQKWFVGDTDFRRYRPGVQPDHAVAAGAGHGDSGKRRPHVFRPHVVQAHPGQPD